MNASERLRRVADELSEHYDSVLVMGTARDGAGTVVDVAERGNHLANVGVVRLWLVRQERGEGEGEA